MIMCRSIISQCLTKKLYRAPLTLPCTLYRKVFDVMLPFLFVFVLFVDYPLSGELTEGCRVLMLLSCFAYVIPQSHNTS